MKVLLFKKTTDKDLFKGLQVACADTFGQHTKTGIITEVYTFTYPITYEVDNSGMYLADELKLIDYEQADSFDQLKQAVVTQKAFVPVTERLFYYALEVLPPKYLKNGTFQMDECETRDLYYTFGEKNGQYLGCLCNSNFALNNF